MTRPSAEEQVNRNRQIVLERAQGYTLSAIAARHGIKVRRVQQIVREHREAQSVDAVSGTEAIVEVVERLEQAIQEYAELIATTTHSAVRLGAINGKVRAVERLVAVEQALGILPRSLALVENQEFALWLSDALNEVVHRMKINAPSDVLEPLDDLLLKLEGDVAAWRRHQAYPRIRGELSAKQAQREIIEEQARIERDRRHAQRAQKGATSDEVAA